MYVEHIKGTLKSKKNKCPQDLPKHCHYSLKKLPYKLPTNCFTNHPTNRHKSLLDLNELSASTDGQTPFSDTRSSICPTREQRA